VMVILFVILWVEWQKLTLIKLDPCKACKEMYNKLCLASNIKYGFILN